MAANQYMQPWFDTLAQGVQVAQHLRQAAVQQKQLQQARQEFQQRQNLQNQEFGLHQQLEKARLVQAGATPVDAQGNVNLPGSTPSFGDPLGVAPLPSAPAASFAASPNRTVTIGTSAFELPSDDELTQDAADRQRAIYNATAVPISDQAAKALGVAPGTRLPAREIAGYGGLSGALARAGKAQPKKPVPWRTSIVTADNGKSSEVVTYSDGSVKEIPLQAKGRTDKFVNPGTPGTGNAGAGVTPDAGLANRSRELKTYSNLLSQESQLNQQRLRLGAALRTGTYYLDKNGNLKPMTDKYGAPLNPQQIAAQQDDMRQRFDAATNELKNVVNQKYDVMGRVGAKPRVPRAQVLAAIDAGSGKKSAQPSANSAQPQAAGRPNTIYRTAVNPKTGKRVGWNGTAWVPLQ